MIENRQPVLSASDPPPAIDPGAAWVEGDLSAEPIDVRGKRILLVDDQDSVRSALRMMVELDGHQVTEARNGADALRLFGMSVFDLVITDYEMPLMRGDELVFRLKQLSPSLPILMITASEKARNHLGNPADALLDKPFMLAELRGALERLLSTRRDPAQVDAVPA